MRAIAAAVGVAEQTFRESQGRESGAECPVVRDRRKYMLRVVRQSLAGVNKGEPRQFSRFIALATAAAVTYSVALPLLRLYFIATDPSEQGRTIYAVAAMAFYLPLQVWLVLSAARDAWGRAQSWALVAIAAVMIGMLPVIGPPWVGILYMLAALVLVTVRLPWSLLLYGVLLAAPTLLTFAFGQPQWALYFTTGMLMFPVPLAVGIWSIRGARQLQAARLALAEEAVVRERLRIDGEMRETLGAGLEEIATCGEHAGELVTSDPPASAQELRGLVGSARRTLAEARRMVTRYREVSMRTELETAATLLSAAGIDARLDLPVGELPDTIDEGERAALRREIARLLGETARASVSITVTRREGRVRLELRSSADTRGVGVAVR